MQIKLGNKTYRLTFTYGIFEDAYDAGLLKPGSLDDPSNLVEFVALLIDEDKRDEFKQLVRSSPVKEVLPVLAKASEFVNKEMQIDYSSEGEGNV